MSHPSRPWTRGTSPRRGRAFRLDQINPLEERCLLAPYLPLTPNTVTFTAAATPTNTNLGTVTVTPGAEFLGAGQSPVAGFITAAPVTSVSELTPSASFGGDIVRLAAGPGGVFGNGLYAISRGAGGNTGAVNNPGVIYRIDPATGKASVFFDLNTVISQKEANGTAANSVGPATGLVNWYDITFDPEGYFNGKPSMFVASVDRSDPNKNAVYQIGSDGSLLGVFVQFTAGQSALKFDVNPSAILVPPVQDQSFLRGMFAGSGISSTGGTFSALFFDSNQYRPGQNISSSTLPSGVDVTNLTEGPIVGLTASNPNYLSAVYSAFTDFGTPAAGGIPARPGLSGVQGSGGEFLIQPPAGTAITPTLPLDQQPTASSLGRRFEDIAFDQYGYFSQGFTLTTNTATTGNGQGNLVDGVFSISQPVNAGSVFVTDLASGLQVPVTPLAPLPTASIEVPVQGSGPIGVQSNGSGGVTPILTNGNTTGGSNATGGRILRILPNGRVSIFAQGFNTSGAQDSTSFVDSSLSIAFSADGTTLYASDNDGIWQFKTVTSLASATSGSLIGLNDLRTFGVPYDGQGSAVAIVDTGVDANTAAFRGRVAPGMDVITNGFGNQDNAPGVAGATTTTTTTTTTAAGTLTSTGANGHGTMIAGVVAQFVPQATLVPVNVFNPFQVTTGFTQTSGTTGTGTNGGTTGTTVSNTSNVVTSSQNVWKGLKYVATHPFVADPIRPNTVDRVVASTFAFGTLETFASEGDAYRRYPQVVNALKFQLHKFLKLGIAPIAASGELGEPYAAAVAATSTTGGTNGGGTGGTTSGKGGTGGTTGTSNGIFGNDNSDNKNVGDDNGMSLPAILNEVISVTGTIPFPFTALPSTPPTDPPQGVVPRPTGPILVYTGNTIGGTSGTTTTTTTTSTGGNNLALLTAGNFAIYSDTMLASSNRSNTTDFAAPALDVPTFRRTFVTTATTTGTTTATDPTDNLVFNQSGTSLSAAEVTGAYALVSSALNYWTQLSQANGVTSDAYLTTPVGVNSLNFGAGSILNLNAYNNPNGINAILAWTAVPVQDANNGLSASTPALITGTNNTYKSYARLSVGDAVAAIEGYQALNYLISHNDLHYLESNNNGIVTAQSIQDFVDNSAKMGLAEAGAMARLLGGTATTAVTSPTAANENPDQPGALQRRFNFFDYAADGQLNGGITISQLQMLAHTLLPSPDAFLVTNRAAASANGFLIDPSAQRNFKNLQHILPRFEYAPLTLNHSYANSSPSSFKVDRGVPPGVNFPIYSLFSSSAIQVANTLQSSSSNGSTNPTTTKVSNDGTTGAQTTTSTPVPISTTTTTGATTTGTTTTGTTTTGTTSTQTQAQQLITAALSLAQGNSPNAPQPAGTVGTPTPSSSGTTSAGGGTTAGSTTSNSTTVVSNPTPITPTTATSTTTTPTTSSTTTPTTSTTGSTGSTTSSSSQTSSTSASIAAAGSAPKPIPVPKKSSNVFTDIGNSLKKTFGF